MRKRDCRLVLKPVNFVLPVRFFSRLTVAAFVLFLTSLTSSSVFAQICPISVDGYPLQKPTNLTTKFNEISCKPGMFGSEECHTFCYYQLPKAAITGIPVTRIYAVWTSKPYTSAPPNYPYAYDACKPLQYTTRINSPNKVVIIDFDWTGNVGTESYAFGKKAAQMVLGQIENMAVSCPGATGITPPESNAAFCRQNAVRLRNLLSKSVVIDDEIGYLANYKPKEDMLRESLSYYNKLVAAFNTPDYNGEYKTTVKNLRNDPTARKAMAQKFGIPDMGDPIVLVRNMRDITAAKVDYLRTAPARQSALNDAKIFNEAEIAKVRLQMSQKQCGGRFDINSCDLGGNWTFYAGDEKESWKFYPSAEGKYTGQSETTGAVAMVEVYEKEAIIRWRTTDNSGSYKLTLAEFCNSGNGEKRYSGSEQQVSFTASRKDTARIFLQDKPYTIFYNGKYYETTYQYQVDKGIPIDIFFFKTLAPNGYQAEQNGDKLWGKFVREPASSHTDQSKVVWWYSDWRWDGNKWVYEHKPGVVVEIK